MGTLKTRSNDGLLKIAVDAQRRADALSGFATQIYKVEAAWKKSLASAGMAGHDSLKKAGFIRDRDKRASIANSLSADLASAARMDTKVSDLLTGLDSVGAFGIVKTLSGAVADYSAGLTRTIDSVSSAFSERFGLVANALPRLPSLNFQRTWEDYGFNGLLDQATRASERLHALVGEGSYLYYVDMIGDPDTPEDEKVKYLEHLRKDRHRYPVPAERWRAHSIRLKAAIAERAEALGISEDRALDTVIEEALFTVCVELRRPRARACIVVDRQRQYFENLTAWEDLGITGIEGYARNRLSDEVMSILVPDWRELEAQQKAKNPPEFVAVDEVSNELRDVRASDLYVYANAAASQLMNHSLLSEDQRMLLRLMAEEDLTATEAGLRMGKASSWGRVIIGRIQEKVKKTSRGCNG